MLKQVKIMNIKIMRLNCNADKLIIFEYTHEESLTEAIDINTFAKVWKLDLTQYETNRYFK